MLLADVSMAGIRGGDVKAFAAVACKKTQLIVVLVWCDIGTGTKVGRATMSRNVFHFCLALGKYEANSFHLHAGQCVASDGRAQATNGGVCVPSDIAAHDKVSAGTHWFIPEERYLMFLRFTLKTKSIGQITLNSRLEILTANSLSVT